MLKYCVKSLKRFSDTGLNYLLDLVLADLLDALDVFDVVVDGDSIVGVFFSLVQGWGHGGDRECKV